MANKFLQNLNSAGAILAATKLDTIDRLAAVPSSSECRPDQAPLLLGMHLQQGNARQNATAKIQPVV